MCPYHETIPINGFPLLEGHLRLVPGRVIYPDFLNADGALALQPLTCRKSVVGSHTLIKAQRDSSNFVGPTAVSPRLSFDLWRDQDDASAGYISLSDDADRNQFNMEIYMYGQQALRPLVDNWRFELQQH